MTKNLVKMITQAINKPGKKVRKSSTDTNKKSDLIASMPNPMSITTDKRWIPYSIDKTY